MKKILNGTIYDTETSVKIVSHNTHSGWNTHNSFSSSVAVTETLFRSKSDKWFMIRERRGMLTSLLSEPQFNHMTIDDAYDWLHKFNEIELLIRYFPDRVSD